MKNLDISHCSTSTFAFPIFKVIGPWSSELLSRTKAGTALRCASALSPPSPNKFPCDFDIAPITHVTMRPIYSLDAGENPCRLSLMELSNVRWGTQSPICVSKLIRRKFNSCSRFQLYSHATLRQGRQVLCDFRPGQPSPSRQEVIQGVKVH